MNVVHGEGKRIACDDVILKSYFKSRSDNAFDGTYDIALITVDAVQFQNPRLDTGNLYVFE